MQYALVAQEKQYPLQVGKNVVGRSPMPVEGVSFINLESPHAAISRMQAFLDVATNGDAWIADCSSTNGTYLSIRAGPGIRLESNRYYQLTPGCRIVFGDVECTFEALSAAPQILQQTTSAPSSSTTRAPRKTEQLAVLGASVDSVPSAVNSSRSAQTEKRKTTAGKSSRSNVPYLDESPVSSQEADNSSANATSEKADTKRKSRTSTRTPAAPAKKAKTEAAASSPAKSTEKGKSSPSKAGAATAPPPVVCITGMDSDERAAITKRVRGLKGRVVDDITKANLLVVATPPVRTPKFIIAVARGIPVVSVNYICNAQAELDDPRRHIVGLKSVQHTYTAAALEKVIYRSEHRPLLAGVQVNVSALSAKTRAVATEIITASGGEVVRTKKGDALSVTDDQLDTLYDSILRGKVPTTL